jgi:tRNA pseudouridine55 synthase
MDGLFIVNKPAGPTSHDVVARMRRILRQRRVGHTGTLDPTASGVLPIVVGRATRLAKFLSGADKSYEARVRLGIETDTFDSSGAPVGSVHTGPFPTAETVRRALDGFRGTFMQQPPIFSAKKVDGKRSHRLARARAHGAQAVAEAVPLPATARVTVTRLEVLHAENDALTLALDCSAGFYVRTLAHDLGKVLGTGAHLESLVRHRSGQLTLADAVDLAALERNPQEASASLVPLERMLPDLARIVLTMEGVRRAEHGRDLGPADYEGIALDAFVRLFDPAGQLVGIAEPAATRGLLHPSVVLR